MEIEQGHKQDRKFELASKARGSTTEWASRCGTARVAFCARSLFRGSRCSTLALSDASHEHTLGKHICTHLCRCQTLSARGRQLQCIHVPPVLRLLIYRKHAIITTSYYCFHLLFPHHGRTAFGIVAKCQDTVGDVRNGATWPPPRPPTSAEPDLLVVFIVLVDVYISLSLSSRVSSLLVR